MFKSITNNVSFSFVKTNKDEGLLFKFNQVTKHIEELYQGVDLKSQPGFIDDKIMFVIDKDEKYNIATIDAKGDLSHLIEGRYPISLSNGEIIYQYGNSLYKWVNGNSKLLKEDAHIFRTPILSTNEEWIAFFHWTYKYDVSHDTLSLMHIDDEEINNVSAYKKIHHKGSGVTWYE